MAAKASIGLTTDLGDLRRELAKLPNLSGDAAQEMLVKVERAVTRAEKTSKKAIKSTGRAQRKAMKEAEKAAAKAKERMAALGTAALGAGVALGAMAQQVADLRNDLADASTRSGVTAENIAGLKLAAEGAGLALSDVTGVTDKLPGILAKAARGTGAQAEAFAKMGVAVTEANGELRSSDAVLMDTLSALSAIEDPTTRAALATEALGKSGTKMLQALGDPASLAAFSEMAERFGVEHGPKAAASAANWQRAMANLTLVMDGFKARIVDVFGGSKAIEDFTRGFIAMEAFVTSKLETMSKGVNSFGAALAAVARGDMRNARKAFAELGEAASEGIGNEAAIAAVTEAVAAYNTLNRTMAETSGGAEAFATAQTTIAYTSKGASDALKAEAAAAKELAKDLEVIDKVTTKAGQGQLSAIEKVEAARDAQIEQLDELLMKHQGNAEVIAAVEAGWVAVIEGANAEIAELRAEELEAYLAMQDEKAAKVAELAGQERQAAQQTRDAYASTYGAMAGMVGDFAQIAIDNADTQSEAGQIAAMQAFRAQKAAGISSALISGTAAAIAALSPPPVGLGPVLGPVQALAVGASTAAAVAKIGAQKPPAFDVGGVIGAGGLMGSSTPDQVLIRALPGERVQSRQEVAQGGASPGPITIIQRYGHRTFDAVAADQVENPGSSLYRSINGSSTDTDTGSHHARD